MYINKIFLLKILQFLYIVLYGNNPMEEELCLVDSATTNSILRELKYFQTMEKMNGDILTIAGRDTVIVGSGRAIFTLPGGTQVTIEDALLYPDSS